MITVDNKYGVGDIVYLRTDKDQLQRIVYAIKVTKADIIYELCQGTTTSSHYDFEITTEKDVLIELS